MAQSKRMSDRYKHINEKAARKASDELARVKAAQRAEAGAKLDHGSTAPFGSAVFPIVIPACNDQSATVQ